MISYENNLLSNSDKTTYIFLLSFARESGAGNCVIRRPEKLRMTDEEGKVVRTLDTP